MALIGEACYLESLISVYISAGADKHRYLSILKISPRQTVVQVWMLRESSPLSRQCAIVDSNDHLLLTCIVFEQLRNNLRASLGIGALHYNWICTISTFNRRACSAVLHFLQSTNLF
ncbi:hypothetical protein AVEN_178845-1 [Araneus ventricosus]|uniref:Uncharacterized protein n=1 Tax=Araneus ventricosus TaxID=182803 RepID=A0A4Y2BGK5_ARAVE|nr:hypothetical protein AVEN_178845-1 [Araneus ventricosus]